MRREAESAEDDDVRVDSWEDEGEDEGGGDGPGDESVSSSSWMGRTGRTGGGDGGCCASYAARDTVSADIV